MIRVVFVCFVLFCFASLVAQEDLVYQNMPYDVQIDLDGQADETIWQQLRFSDFFVGLKKADSPISKRTRFKMFSTKDELLLLIEFQGQSLEELRVTKDKKQFNPANSFSLYLAPRPELDDHYRVSIDFWGNLDSVFLPAKAGHGYPYTALPDKEWQSGLRLAFAEKAGNVYAELLWPIKTMPLEKNLFTEFGFNITRRATWLKETKKIVEETSWAYVNGDIWESQKFGSVQGPLKQKKHQFQEKDFHNIEQMTNGATALFKSLDVYTKATLGYYYFVPEGSEIDGNLNNFDHIPIPQYPVKADGYYRFYLATSYEPYKLTADRFIERLYRLYSETSSIDGKHYLIWNNLMDKDGKVYSYGNGNRIITHSVPFVQFNQSRNLFFLEDVMFLDGFGQGFYDLSELKGLIGKEAQQRVIEMLNGTLEFVNSKEIFVDNETGSFWRLDAFSTQEKIADFSGKIKEKDWALLGMDVIFMYMALHRFQADLAKKFEANMTKFSKFYIANRLKLEEESAKWKFNNLFKLDSRLLEFGAFVKENNLESLYFLEQWLQENLAKLYENLPNLAYSENGATSHSKSTQEYFEIFRLLNKKTQFREFWKESFEKRMTLVGIQKNHRILPMNFSSYPLYFDYAQKAYQAKILNEKDLTLTLKKMFLFYGNPKILRYSYQYALDLPPEIKENPSWGSVPYDAYVEGVLPEGIYANGISLAYYVYFADYVVNEFFPFKGDSAKYSYSVRYYQYASPFQYHYDRYSYGKAESMCLMKNLSMKVSEMSDGYKIEAQFELPDIPAGSPVFGHLDLSSTMLYDKNGQKLEKQYQVTSVSNNEAKVAFQSYQIMNYDGPLSLGPTKAKLVVGLFKPVGQKLVTIQIMINEKQLKDYFEKSAY